MKDPTLHDIDLHHLAAFLRYLRNKRNWNGRINGLGQEHLHDPREEVFALIEAGPPSSTSRADSISFDLAY